MREATILKQIIYDSLNFAMQVKTRTAHKMILLQMSLHFQNSMLGTVQDQLILGNQVGLIFRLGRLTSKVATIFAATETLSTLSIFRSMVRQFPICEAQWKLPCVHFHCGKVNSHFFRYIKVPWQNAII